MRAMPRLMLWLLLCVAVLPVQAAPHSGVASASPHKQIERIHAVYDVFKDNIKIATMTETYVRTRDRYQIESVTKATGLLAVFKPETIRTTSEGTLTPQGLRPATFIQTRELDSERNVRADLDWAAGNITLTDRKGKRTQPLRGPTQDRLSAMYQFLFTPLQNVTTLSFNMTNGSKVDQYDYHITPNQNVTVPLGSFNTLYLASVPDGSPRKNEIWLATGHGNFPYKMVVTESNGDKLTQVLTQFDQEP